MPRKITNFLSLSLIVLSGILFGCEGGGSESVSEGDSQAPAEVAVAFVDVASGSQYVSQNFRTVAIKDLSAWNTLWSEIYPAPTSVGAPPVPPLPEINFSQNMVVGVFTVVPTPCQNMAIKSVRIINGQKILVAYGVTTPPAGMVCAQVMVYEFQLVSLPYSNLPAEFVAE